MGTLLLRLVALGLLLAPAAHGFDWNDRRIRWESYPAGLATAKATKKPVCLVVYADWCPQCRTFSKLFHDDRVVQASRDLVMVRVDGDAEEKVAKKYAPDGNYFPRTVFLAPDGRIAPTIRGRGGDSAYNYPTRDPGKLLASMSTARKLR